MRKNIIVVMFTLIIGAICGFAIHKTLVKPVPGDIARFEEIFKVKELHLVKHIYQDLVFIHKKNDASKSVRAIAVIPVEVSAYIDLNGIEIGKRNDSITHIVLPQPRLNDPNYRVDKMEIRKVRDFQIHLGKDLHSEVLLYLKDITARRVESVMSLSLQNGILEETKKESKDYLELLLLGLGLNKVPISFNEKSTPVKESLQTNLKGLNGGLNKLIEYVPELIPANHID